MAATVPIEQGQTTIPPVLWEPEAGSAPRSSSGNTVTEDQSPTAAWSDAMESMPHSSRNRRIPWLEGISQTGTRWVARTWINRRPYGAPEAPVSATTMGYRVMASAYRPVQQREGEHRHAHDAVHGEEGGVQPGEIAGPDQAVLVGEHPRRGNQPGVIPPSETGTVAEQREGGDGDPVQELGEQDGPRLTEPYDGAPQAFGAIEPGVGQ